MSRCPCRFVCGLCRRRIPHGRFFFALTGGRYAHPRCVEHHDLYDDITDATVTSADPLSATESQDPTLPRGTGTTDERNTP